MRSILSELKGCSHGLGPVLPFKKPPMRIRDAELHFEVQLPFHFYCGAGRIWTNILDSRLRENTLTGKQIL